MDKSEQWNLDGDCSLCRRKNYCSKPCTRNKREADIMMRSLVASKLNEATGGAYSEMMGILADGRVKIWQCQKAKQRAKSSTELEL